MVGLLHAGAQRTAADQHDHIAGLDGMFAQAFDRRDRGAFAGEHARRTGLAIDAIRIDHTRIDGGAFDDRALWREVAGEKSDRAGQTARAGLRGIHDHIIGVDAIERLEALAQFLTAFALFPFFE